MAGEVATDRWAAKGDEKRDGDKRWGLPLRFLQ